VALHLVLHYTGPSFPGGVETLIADFLELASFAGQTVRLLIGKGHAPTLPDNASVVLPLLDAEHPVIRVANHELLRGSRTAATDTLVRELSETLAAVIPNGSILHAHNVATNYFNLPLTIALHDLISRRPDLRLLAWTHDPGWMSLGLVETVDWTQHPFTLLVTPWTRTHYVTLSPLRQQLIRAKMHLDDNRLSCITHYVSPSRLFGISRALLQRLLDWGILDTDVSLLYPCRMSRRKNIEAALRVTRSIKDRGKSVRLVLSGFDSPHRSDESRRYREQVEQQIGKLELSDDACILNPASPSDHLLHGAVERSDIIGLHRFLDVALFTSHDEGFGLGALEAALLGTPTIASHASVPSIIAAHVVARYLIEDSDQIAAAILDAVDKRAARKRLLRSLCDPATRWKEIEGLLVHLSNEADLR
jgi:glycosyltransferase involved in cell wall biosynthesis